MSTGPGSPSALNHAVYLVSSVVVVLGLAFGLSGAALGPWGLAAAAAAALFAFFWWLAMRRLTSVDSAALSELTRRTEHDRLILAGAPMVLYTVDTAGIVTFAEGHGLMALGLTPATLIGKSIFALYPDVPDLRQRLERGLASETFHDLVDLGDNVLESWSSPMVDRAGTTTGLIGVAIDVTARERAAKALKDSERKYRELTERASDGIFILNLSGRLIEINTSARELLGFSRDDPPPHTLEEMIAPEDLADKPLQRQAVLAGASLRHERRLRRKDGSSIEVEMSVKRIGDERVLAIIRDITERKRAEAALRDSEARFRQLYNKTPAMLHSIDPEGRIIHVSDAWLARLGYTREEVIGRRSVEFLTPESRRIAVEERLPLLFRRGWSKDSAYQMVGKSGEIFDIQISAISLRDEQGQLFATMAVVTDVTERKRTETALKRSQEQLLHAQKMEAIGRLAGGMAHDFNNLLTALIGYGEMLKRSVESDDRLRPLAEGVLKAAQRGATLTRQLLIFSRKQVMAPTTIDLGSVIADLAPMLRRLIGEDIELVVGDPPPGARVKADPNQIGQVLMNLAVNARDAMPEGGRVSISTARVHIDDSGADTDIPPGDYVRLQVTDSGMGMNEEIQSHLFEPFFTTKQPGVGTGLGLSIIYGIVKQSSGHIQVTSQPGHGTTFTILLPRDDHAPDVMRTSTPSRGVTTGAETVLLVEDEDEIRSLLGDHLRERGYRVVTAASGDEALRLHHQLGNVDLLVSDVVMPRMSGRELADRLRQQQPDLKVLFMSGYTGNDSSLELLRASDHAFIAKPFAPGELVRQIHDLLTADRSG